MIHIPIQTWEEFTAETREILRRPFKLGPIFWGDLEKPGKEYDWIIKGVIPEKEIILGFGESQAGKSYFFSDLGMSIARGVPYLGRKTKQGLVIYVALEAGRGFRKRMKAYQRFHAVEGDVPFVALTRRLDLFASETDITDLIDEVKGIVEMFDVPLRLVVLDTWSAGTRGANENSGEDVGKVLGRVYRLRDEVDAAVAIVHHKPKGGATPRGHGSLTGDLETTIEIVRTDKRDDDNREIRRARITKQREGEDGVAWEFVLRAVTVGYDSDGDPITACVVTGPNGGEGESPDAQGGKNAPRMTEDGRWFLGPNLTIGMRALQEALTRKGRAAPPTARVPAGTECVTLSDWRDEWARLAAKEDEDPERLKERVKKARDGLVAKLLPRGFLGKDGDWVWRTNKRVFGVDQERTHPDVAPNPPGEDIGGLDAPF